MLMAFKTGGRFPASSCRRCAVIAPGLNTLFPILPSRPWSHTKAKYKEGTAGVGLRPFRYGIHE